MARYGSSAVSLEMNNAVIAQVRHITAASRDGNTVEFNVVFRPSVAMYDRVPADLLRAFENEVAVSFDLIFCFMTVSFSGFVTAIKPTASYEDELTGLVTIKIVGAVSTKEKDRVTVKKGEAAPEFIRRTISLF